MPTPIEILLDPVSLIVLAMYAFLMLWETIFPARKLPHVKFWRLKGLLFFMGFFYLSSYLPLLTDPFLAKYQLIDLSGLPTISGVAIGVLFYQLCLYTWHFSIHRSNFLWRTFHQMHHSAERLDTFGAFYFSPMDMIAFTLLGSVVFALLMGLPPQSITAIILLLNFFSVFQHANIKTPHWLGYIIQRPESHTLHHGKGIHKYNYSDLPLYDIVFGTFKNPKGYESETGFYQGGSSKVWDMILFRDISSSKEIAK